MTKPWKHLAPWLTGSAPPVDGAAALDALAAVTEVRRLLDQAELAAVRTARRTGRSWTEIATMLAITRQSAWERWRDLDDDDTATGVLSIVAEEVLAEELVQSTTREPARRGRRRRTVAVPDVIGLTAADAVSILTRAGLDAGSATADVPLLEQPGTQLRPAVVVRQYPDSGTRVQGASTVRLWLERGDGEAGVREPRRPVPPPRSARAERLDETVG